MEAIKDIESLQSETDLLGVNLPLKYWHSQRLPWWLRWLGVCLQRRRPMFDPWVRRIPWRRDATHSNILAWRIPWTKEPSGLQSTQLQRVRHDWMTRLILSLSWHSQRLHYQIRPADRDWKQTKARRFNSPADSELSWPYWLAKHLEKHKLECGMLKLDCLIKDLDNVFKLQAMIHHWIVKSLYRLVINIFLNR